jgi:hypothetical protein
LIKGVPPRWSRTREVMTHNFTKSPRILGRRGNCTKPKIGHIACRFFEKSTQGETPFQHSHSLVMGRRQKNDAKVDQKVCKSILHPDLTRFKGHILENLQRILRGSPMVSSPDLIFGALTRAVGRLKPCIGPSIGQYCLHHVPGLAKHIESAMVRPKGRARELIVHNTAACNDQPSLAARTERQF